MTHDRFSQFPTSRDSARPRPFVTGGLLLAGVVCAALLGVGLGLWARPAMSERRMVIASPAFRAETEKPRGRIQIVLEEAPAPVGEPIEVLPHQAGEPVLMIERAVPPEPRASVRPAEGLMKVTTRAPRPRAVQIAAVKPTPSKPDAAAKAKGVQTARATPDADKPVRLAKVSKARAPTGRTRVILASAAPHKARAAAAHPEKVKYERPAKMTAKKPVVAKPPAKPARVEKAAARKARPAPRREAAPTPPIRATGLMKVSNRSRCGQSDPGAAIVCADPSLGAADRQLTRAYRDALAAGVSDDQLQRQQQRWLAARAAAAREAPWAVHDVYLARIAELNGMAREAGGN